MGESCYAMTCMCVFSGGGRRKEGGREEGIILLCDVVLCCVFVNFVFPFFFNSILLFFSALTCLLYSILEGDMGIISVGAVCLLVL